MLLAWGIYSLEHCHACSVRPGIVSSSYLGPASSAESWNLHINSSDYEVVSPAWVYPPCHPPATLILPCQYGQSSCPHFLFAQYIYGAPLALHATKQNKKKLYCAHDFPFLAPVFNMYLFRWFPLPLQSLKWHVSPQGIKSVLMGRVGEAIVKYYI